MKKIVVILFLLFNLSWAESDTDKNIWSFGTAAGSYGYGPYWRNYVDDDYYQITGFYSYDNTYGIDSTLGLCYGTYIYEDSKKDGFFFPNNVSIKTGGYIYSAPEYIEYLAAIGVAFEYKHPNKRGFSYEVSLDYVGLLDDNDYSERIYLGVRGSFQIGFNF